MENIVLCGGIYVFTKAVMNKIADYRVNIRWIVVCEDKMLCTFYIPQNTINYLELKLLDDDGIRVDVLQILMMCRNVENIVYCRQDYSTAVYVQDNILNIISRLGNRYRQMFPRLTTTVQTTIWYNTLKYAICNEVCADQDLKDFIKERYDNWINEYTQYSYYNLPVTGWYCGKVTENMLLQQGLNLYSMFLASNCTDVITKNTSTVAYDSLLFDTEQCICDIYKMQSVFSDDDVNSYKAIIVRTNSYLKTYCTKILCRYIQKMWRMSAVQSFRIDTFGFLWLNNKLCNIKIPYTVLLGVSDDVWRAVVGCTQDEFDKLYKQQYKIHKNVYESTILSEDIFCEIIQEQHIPRWGYIFDFNYMLHMQNLREISIEDVNIAIRMQRENTLTWDKYVSRFKNLHTGNFRINGGCVYNNGFIDGCPGNVIVTLQNLCNITFRDMVMAK